MNNQPHHGETDYVTIIGDDMTDITRQFQAEGLSGSDYAIVHRIGSHRFTAVDGGVAQDLFIGRRIIAATFARRLPAPTPAL